MERSHLPSVVCLLGACLLAGLAIAEEAGEAEPAYEPSVEGGELVLEIPELLSQDCTFCGGHKKRKCWKCGGKGTFVYFDEDVPCHLCKKGKVKCEACKGSGDCPDLLKHIPCPGCSLAAEHSIAPGMWACPLCWGAAKMWIEDEPKPRKCAVCRGKSGFPCVLCGGATKLSRLYAPKSKHNAKAWLKRCEKGLAELERVPLRDGDPLKSLTLLGQAERFPVFKKMAKLLAAHVKHAQSLTNRNIKGTGEMVSYFERVTGESVKKLFDIEVAFLEAEKTWVKKKKE